jgi:hypothetical protein
VPAVAAYFVVQPHRSKGNFFFFPPETCFQPAACFLCPARKRILFFFIALSFSQYITSRPFFQEGNAGFFPAELFRSGGEKGMGGIDSPPPA